MRYFSNLYWDNTWNSKWRTILGFDFGIQDSSSMNDEHLFWMSPVFIAQYSINPKWQTAVRVEYYQDEDNVIVALQTGYDNTQDENMKIKIDNIQAERARIQAEEEAKAAEEAKKGEAEDVLKKLLASGMTAEEILAKLQ